MSGLEERVSKLEAEVAELGARLAVLDDPLSALESPPPTDRQNTQEGAAARRVAAQAALGAKTAAYPMDCKLQDVVDAYVLDVFRTCLGDKTIASEMLGISRRTLYNWLDRIARKPK